MRQHYNIAVLKRYLDDKALKEFDQQYTDNLKHSRLIKRPSEKDTRIYSLVKKEKSYSRVAKMVGLKVYQVIAAVGRAAAYKGN